MTDSWTVLARLPTAVPRDLAVRLDAGDWDRVEPVLSASVVLIREHAAHGLETFLLHRHARMPFAAGMVVFPGGKAEPTDETIDETPIGCALRETQEETGVALDVGDLHRWAHWITPEVSARRFDTHFFIAVLPAGQRAQDISGETDRAGWATPAEALLAAERRSLSLMAPTRSILIELADLGSAYAVLTAAADRRIHCVLPRTIRTPGGGWRFAYDLPRGGGGA